MQFQKYTQFLLAAVFLFLLLSPAILSQQPIPPSSSSTTSPSSGFTTTQTNSPGIVITSESPYDGKLNMVLSSGSKDNNGIMVVATVTGYSKFTYKQIAKYDPTMVERVIANLGLSGSKAEAAREMAQKGWLLFEISAGNLNDIIDTTNLKEKSVSFSYGDPISGDVEPVPECSGPNAIPLTISTGPNGPQLTAACKVPITVTCSYVTASYAGNYQKKLKAETATAQFCNGPPQNYALGQGLTNAITATPPFGFACFAALLIAGVFVSGMYYAGKNPLAIFDITTPRLPKAKKPQFQRTVLQQHTGQLRKLTRQMERSLATILLTKDLAFQNKSAIGKAGYLAMAKVAPSLLASEDMRRKLATMRREMKQAIEAGNLADEERLGRLVQAASKYLGRNVTINEAGLAQLVKDTVHANPDFGVGSESKKLSDMLVKLVGDNRVTGRGPNLSDSDKHSLDKISGMWMAMWASKAIEELTVGKGLRPLTSIPLFGEFVAGAVGSLLFPRHLVTGAGRAAATVVDLGWRKAFRMPAPILGGFEFDWKGRRIRWQASILDKTYLPFLDVATRGRQLARSILTGTTGEAIDELINHLTPAQKDELVRILSKKEITLPDGSKRYLTLTEKLTDVRDFLARNGISVSLWGRLNSTAVLDDLIRISALASPSNTPREDMFLSVRMLQHLQEAGILQHTTIARCRYMSNEEAAFSMEDARRMMRSAELARMMAGIQEHETYASYAKRLGEVESYLENQVVQKEIGAKKWFGRQVAPETAEQMHLKLMKVNLVEHAEGVLPYYFSAYVHTSNYFYAGMEMMARGWIKPEHTDTYDSYRDRLKRGLTFADIYGLNPDEIKPGPIVTTRDFNVMPYYDPIKGRGTIQEYDAIMRLTKGGTASGAALDLDDVVRVLSSPAGSRTHGEVRPIAEAILRSTAPRTEAERNEIQRILASHGDAQFMAAFLASKFNTRLQALESVARNMGKLGDVETAFAERYADRGAGKGRYHQMSYDKVLGELSSRGGGVLTKEQIRDSLGLNTHQIFLSSQGDNVMGRRLINIAESGQEPIWDRVVGSVRSQKRAMVLEKYGDIIATATGMDRDAVHRLSYTEILSHLNSPHIASLIREVEGVYQQRHPGEVVERAWGWRAWREGLDDHLGRNAQLRMMVKPEDQYGSLRIGQDHEFKPNFRLGAGETPGFSQITRNFTAGMNIAWQQGLSKLITPAFYSMTYDVNTLHARAFFSQMFLLQYVTAMQGEISGDASKSVEKSIEKLGSKYLPVVSVLHGLGNEGSGSLLHLLENENQLVGGTITPGGTTSRYTLQKAIKDINDAATNLRTFAGSGRYSHEEILEMNRLASQLEHVRTQLTSAQHGNTNAPITKEHMELLFGRNGLAGVLNTSEAKYFYKGLGQEFSGGTAARFTNGLLHGAFNVMPYMFTGSSPLLAAQYQATQVGNWYVNGFEHIVMRTPEAGSSTYGPQARQDAGYHSGMGIYGNIIGLGLVRTQHGVFTAYQGAVTTGSKAAAALVYPSWVAAKVITRLFRPFEEKFLGTAVYGDLHQGNLKYSAADKMNVLNRWPFNVSEGASIPRVQSPIYLDTTGALRFRNIFRDTTLYGVNRDDRGKYLAMPTVGAVRMHESTYDELYGDRDPETPKPKILKRITDPHNPSAPQMLEVEGTSWVPSNPVTRRFEELRQQTIDTFNDQTATIAQKLLAAAHLRAYSAVNDVAGVGEEITTGYAGEQNVVVRPRWQAGMWRGLYYNMGADSADPSSPNVIEGSRRLVVAGHMYSEAEGGTRHIMPRGANALSQMYGFGAMAPGWMHSEGTRDIWRRSTDFTIADFTSHRETSFRHMYSLMVPWNTTLMPAAMMTLSLAKSLGHRAGFTHGEDLLHPGEWWSQMAAPYLKYRAKVAMGIEEQQRLAGGRPGILQIVGGYAMSQFRQQFTGKVYCYGCGRFIPRGGSCGRCGTLGDFLRRAPG